MVVASNRGPISFVRDEEGRVVAERGAGGLVTALTAALEASGGLWIAAAMSEEDREQAARGRVELAQDASNYHLRYLAFDPGEYERFYNTISNRVLWFLHHYLWDVPRVPTFGRETWTAWESYVRVNRAFADAMSEEGPPGSAFLVQDYHLDLVPALLRDRRGDALISHFSHIPFPGPSYFQILPARMRDELMHGILGADVVGFNAHRWAQNFLLSCQELNGAEVDLANGIVRWERREVHVSVYPISVDVETLAAGSRKPDVTQARRWLLRALNGKRLILRVDRTDLSKNILRGFLAYEAFLTGFPKWRGKVRFLALLNPSRETIPEYSAYLEECVRTAQRINHELGDESWQPIELSLRDDFPLSLAAYGMYDVLLVNPIYDGMNLVAKEGPVLNRRKGVLVLSENAGAFAELSRYVLAVNPFDVDATAEALRAGLEMGERERDRRIRGLRSAIRRNRLDRWVSAQLEDLEREGEKTSPSQPGQELHQT